MTLGRFYRCPFSHYSIEILERGNERERMTTLGLGAISLSFDDDVDVHLCRDDEKRSPISIVEFGKQLSNLASFN